MIREKLKYDKRSGIRLLFTDFNIDDDVDMGLFRISEEPIFTSAAFTCIALAAHNSHSRQGLIGHFNSVSDTGPHSSGESFRHALQGIASLGEARHTTVWMGGGSPSIEGGEDIVMADRRLAEEAVMDFASSFRLPEGHVAVEWSEQDQVVDVELDCPTGILAIHDYPDMPSHLLRQMIVGDPEAQSV